MRSRLRRAPTLLAIAVVASLGLPARANAPAAPSRHAPDLSHFSPRTPLRSVHTEYVVETNRLGQVTRVRSVRPSNDPPFNALTYGNALQAFIRTRAGSAISGTYRLGYDYDPQTKNVRRSVLLVRPGGVDPNAPGAVLVEAEKLRKQKQKAQIQAQAQATALPDLKHITGKRR